jgi:hypothetical protein
LSALQDCTDQLHRIHGISISIVNLERLGDIHVVTARPKDRTGREDENTGAVAIGNLKGDALCNALMKGETKAKRRVTLSMAGLGWLDETELDTIPSAADEHLRASEPVTPHPLQAGQGSAGSHVEAHPSANEITTLVATAMAANVSLEDFGHDMRRLMNLPPLQKITKKYLRETMTMSEYEIARKGYGEKLRVSLTEDVPDHKHPSATRDASVSEAVLEAAAEKPTCTMTHYPTPRPPAKDHSAVPSEAECSSARDPDVAAPMQVPAGTTPDEAKARLRPKALSWGVREAEVAHIISHHPLATARSLLCRARRGERKTTLAAALAAD